jgi:CAAX protease family protein
MRPVRAVALYLVFVFLGGALLAPWVYALVQSASGVLPGLRSLASMPFPRYVNRSFLILGVVGLWPFLRATGLGSARAMGLARRSDGLGQIGWGFIVGLVSLACVVFIVLASGVRAPAHEHSAGAILAQFLKSAVIAMVVAPLEEVFFRGALFGSLRKTFHWSLALLLSSALYALLHFLEHAQSAGPVGWASGFEVLCRMLAGFADAQKLMPGFLNLTLAGIILGFAYQRSGSLHFSIGLHAGWIFWLKTYGFVTVETAASRAWFYGTGKLINGWLAFIVLASVLAILSRVLVEDDPQVGWKERRLLS